MQIIRKHLLFFVSLLIFIGVAGYVLTLNVTYWNKQYRDKFETWSKEAIQRDLLKEKASSVYRNFKYLALGDSPTNAISVTDDRIFLNRHGDVAYLAPFSAFYRSCFDHTFDEFSAVSLNRLEKAIRQRPEFDFNLLIAPSKPVLLADDLPANTPVRTVQDCKRENRNSSLKAMIEGRDFAFYPLEELKPKVDDPIYYPSSNFHWQGQSVLDGLRPFLHARDVTVEGMDDVFVRRTVKGDMALMFQNRGREMEALDFEGWKHFKRNDEWAGHLLGFEGRHVSVLGFENLTPTGNGTIAVLADSFGMPTSRTLALIYDRVLNINLSDMKPEQRATVLDHLKAAGITNILMVYHDASVAGGRFFNEVGEIFGMRDYLIVDEVRNFFVEGSWLYVNPDHAWSAAGKAAFTLPTSYKGRKVSHWVIDGRPFNGTVQTVRVLVDGELVRTLPNALVTMGYPRPVIVPVPEEKDTILVEFDISLLHEGQEEHELPQPVRKNKHHLKQSIVVRGFDAVYTD